MPDARGASSSMQRLGTLPATSRIAKVIEHNRGIRRRLIADIEASAARLGLSDDALRAQLAHLAGQRRCSDLTLEQSAPGRRRAAPTDFPARPRGGVDRRGRGGGDWERRRRTFAALDSREEHGMRIQKDGPVRPCAADEAEQIAQRLVDDDAFAARVTASVVQLLAVRALAVRAKSHAGGHLGAVERES